MLIGSQVDLSFKNDDNDPTRDYFNKYYIALVEIKGFNALIDNKAYLDQSVKNKQEAYKKFAKMSRNDYHTTEGLLNFLYYQSYYKLIGIHLSRQKKYGYSSTN